MSDRVDKYFIEPLEVYYEKRPLAGTRKTLHDELDQFDEASLTRAVQWLKVNRKAMTFPSPPECVKAARLSVGAVVVRGASEPITGKNYAKMASAYAKATGLKKFPVIQKYEAPNVFTAQWAAWQGYWEYLGAKSTLLLVAERPSWTVPTEWPVEFDIAAVGVPPARNPTTYAAVPIAHLKGML